GIFDEILAKVDEQDRSVLEKYPELKETVEKLEQAAVDYAAWYRENWDEEHGMTRSEWAARQQMEDLNRQLELLRSNPSSFSDQGAEDVLEQARSAGMISQAELQKILDERIRTLQQEQDRILSGMQNFYANVYTLGFRHKDEFGEPLNPSELYNYMVKTGLRDPATAYEQMVAPLRQKKMQEQMEQKIREAEERGARKAQEEMAMKSPGLPTDTSGGIAGVSGIASTAATKAELPQDIAEKAKTLSLNDPELSRLGLEALRRGVLTQQ
uniref:hypothetical protein n=1 Tax=Methanothrix sp. TaxID=90426 RepID=UPI0034E2FC69